MVTVARALATGDVATHGAVMYPQKASLDQVVSGYPESINYTLLQREKTSHQTQLLFELLP